MSKCKSRLPRLSPTPEEKGLVVTSSSTYDHLKLVSADLLSLSPSEGGGGFAEGERTLEGMDQYDAE